MRDVQLYVLRVEAKPMQNKPGNRYIVHLSDGSQPSCFDLGIANKANAFSAEIAQSQGQQPQLVTVRIEDKPNPRGGAPYQNFIDVAGPGETLGAPPVQALGAAPLGAVSAPPTAVMQGVPPIPVVSSSGSSGDGMSAENRESMYRSVAMKVAGNIVASLYSGAGDIDPGVVWGKVCQFTQAGVHLIKTGQGAAGQSVNAVQAPAQAPAPEQQPVATTPQEVAAQLPPGLVQVGAPTTQQRLDAAALQEAGSGQQTELPEWLGGGSQ
jgi:hypothetical protein